LAGHIHDQFSRHPGRLCAGDAKHPPGCREERPERPDGCRIHAGGRWQEPRCCRCWRCSARESAW
jgi:hypothetical protein